MKGDILLVIGDLRELNYQDVIDAERVLKEAGVSHMILIDLPNGDAFIGNLAEEKLQKLHKTIHDLLED